MKPYKASNGIVITYRGRYGAHEYYDLGRGLEIIAVDGTAPLLRGRREPTAAQLVALSELRQAREAKRLAWLAS